MRVSRMRRVGAGPWLAVGAPPTSAPIAVDLGARRRVLIGSAVSVTLPSSVLSLAASVRGRFRRGERTLARGELGRAGERVQGRRDDALAATQVEAIARRQGVQDDATDHERTVAVDLPRIGLRLRPIDDRDGTASD